MPEFQSLWHRTLLHPLRSSEDGAVLIQFAGMITGMMLLFLGGFEAAQYVLAYQKAERVANTVSDLVGQQPTSSLLSSQLNDILHAADEITRPFNFATGGKVIVTQIFGGDDGITLGWRACYGAGDGDSAVTVADDEVTLPNGMDLPAGQAAVIAESFITYDPVVNVPLFQNIFRPDTVIRHYSISLNREIPPSEITVNDGSDPQC